MTALGLEIEKKNTLVFSLPHYGRSWSTEFSNLSGEKYFTLLQLL